MRMTDVFLAFPRLILALAFVAALGPGIENAVIAIALTAWPPYARIARAETLTMRGRDFIAAIRLQGAAPLRIVLGHVVPLCISSVIVRVTPRHGRDHPDRRGPRLPRPRRAAALAGMGRHDRLGPAASSSTSGGWRPCPGFAIFIVSLGFNLLGRRAARRARPKADERAPILTVEDLRVRFPGRVATVTPCAA